MNSFSDTHAAIYEEPVDERIRKFLKLESYFLKITLTLQVGPAEANFGGLHWHILL